MLVGETLAATSQDWRSSVLSSLSAKERAGGIAEHASGRNLVCHPLSVSGMNKAFLGTAISESAVLRYHCSASYLWQLLIVQAFLHL